MRCATEGSERRQLEREKTMGGGEEHDKAHPVNKPVERHNNNNENNMIKYLTISQ
jgi:hypothetical protein